MTLPNLFLAGAPKCGTTSMHRYLAEHPDIFMCPVKEPQFYCFDGERPVWNGPGDFWMNERIVVDRADYEGLFEPSADYRYRGDASPYYLWSASAQRRILADEPAARFIVLLRHPVERALSSWGHLWGQGRESERNLADAIKQETRRRDLGWEPFWRYAELGRYGEQIARLLEVLPRDQLKVVYYDDYQADTRATLSEIFEWLTVTDDVAISAEARFMTTPHIRQTLRTRTLQSALSHKSSLKRVVPQQIRRKVGAMVLEELRSAASDGGEPPPIPTELRHLFAADLRLLQDILGDVPQSWLS